MEEKDIQVLFTYMKNDLTLECKSTRLTRSMADAWCDMFSGYSLGQLKEAARAYAREKPYWPKPNELAEKLPALADCAEANAERPFPGWPAYGYRDAEDFRAQMRETLEKSRGG